MAYAMDESADFLTVAGLTKRYGTRVVVSDVSFTLPQGKFLSLLGPSGSGKTTLLRMLAGLTRPDGGLIAIGGQIMYSPQRIIPAEERQLGMVFQDFALWPHMTVAHNIAFGLRLRRMSRDEAHTRVREALALVDLTGFERRYPHQLSGGQQQRVALARALATKPRLLLLDEPLSSLDTGLREVMREELLRIVRTTGATVVNVTHDQDEAMSISDHIVLLRNGQIQQSGAPDELYARPRSAFVGRFMGPANIMTGTIEQVSEATVTLLAGALVAHGERGLPEASVGASASLLCRPEHTVIRETAPEGEPNTWQAVVTRSAFSRGQWRVQADLAHGVTALAFTTQPLAVGQSCSVTFPPASCLVVAADDLSAAELADADAAERLNLVVGAV